MKKQILPNKDTKIFVSMAINPGNTGSKLHNSLFKLLKLNNIYIPLKVQNNTQAKSLIKNMIFSGYSLSMPYKESMISEVDLLDKNAAQIGSINTILKKKNKLIGYNTDYYASKEILNKIKLSKNTKVLLLGFGGVAKAILKSLKDLKFKNITVSTRSIKSFKKSALSKNVNFCEWKNRNNLKVELLVNATPLGMFGKYEKRCPVNKTSLKYIKIIYDLTVNFKKNKLEKMSQKNNIQYYSGIHSSFLQGIKQFEIYNNMKLSRKILNEIQNKR